MEALPQKEALLKYIREQEIGNNLPIHTPYGRRPQLYADYTASGRFLKFIENYISEEVLPLYANTHSNSSQAPLQTAYFREEARQMIKQYIGASDKDSLIFCGSGSTAAVNKLVHALRFKEICDSLKGPKRGKESTRQNGNEKYCVANRFGTYDCTLCQTVFATMGKYQQHCASQMHKRNLQRSEEKTIKFTDRPIVFVSVFEHTSNLVPWRETGAQIEIIPMTQEGDFDYNALEQQLGHSAQAHPHSIKVGTFSAGSNLTGQLFNTDRIAYLCHKYGSLAFFDYACVAPYVNINMNGLSRHTSFPLDWLKPEEETLCYKDAVFISPHKFVGGPGSAGILCVKQRLMLTKVPSAPGGGTVFFVNENEHQFFLDVEDREQAGTPPIIWQIRAGLAFQLKDAVGEDTIKASDETIHAKVIKRMAEMQNLVLLGNTQLPKLPIYVFMIKCRGKYLHYNLVSMLLNDLFGIQTRAGCACAAMFGQQLLGLTLQQTRFYKGLLSEGMEQFRVGYTRLNFAYFWDTETIEYILDAIDFIQKYGWMFLPHYTLVVETGQWVHRNFQIKRKWLGGIKYSSGTMQYPSEQEICEMSKSEIISEAFRVLVESVKDYKQIYGKSALDQKLLFTSDAQEFRWFILPSEVLPRLLQIGKHSNLDSESIKNYIENDALSLQFLPKFGAYKELIPKNSRSVKQEYDASTFMQDIYTEKPEEQEEKEQTNGQVHFEQFTPLEIEDIKKEEIKQREEEKQSEPADEEGDENFVFPSIESKEDLEIEGMKEKSTSQMGNLNPKIPKRISHLVGQAVIQHKMIKEGSRVMVALSGGKDSLSLIHILRNMQRRSPVKFELSACTIDPQVPEYDPSPLIKYLANLNIPYFYVKDPIVERAETCMQNNSICSFCSRMKRGLLYTTARKHNYDVIAMGQHLDDLAESFLMSAFHNGLLRTMKANYTIQAGDLRVIRPLIYCREKMFKDFAEVAQLPVIPQNCPACFSAPKERHRIKLLLAQQEHEFPSLFPNLLKTMKPVIAVSTCDFQGNLKDLINEEEDGD